MSGAERGLEACREAAARLPSEPPAGRLEAVRELEALAVADPALRQPVVDEICAYLRTPATVGAEDAAVRRAALDLLTNRLRPGEQRSDPPTDRPADGPGDAEPWPEIDIDLSGTTLTDVDFSGCELAEADFSDTRFVGTTSFAGARFDGEALFPRTVFEGDAHFDGARFTGEAAFGRARFRGATGFAGAEFSSFAWFGRGEDTLWDDDPAWDTIEEISPLPWDEPNETDPQWPVAVLIEDYQGWEEGGDGARFAGPVSFRGARFGGPAWFHKARFGAAADFRDARFEGRVRLDQAAVDLSGARWSDDDDGDGGDDGPTYWPLGWVAEPEGGRLVPDEDVRPYARQLGDPDPGVRRTGARLLADLGDSRPELRQRVADAVCAYLRTPLPFPLDGELDPGQAEELDLRRYAQRLLAQRLRPSADPRWPDIDLYLCGATLVDFDLSGARAGYGEFTGAQFHGTTSFVNSRFAHADFDLGGDSGRAIFHGPVNRDGAAFR